MDCLQYVNTTCLVVIAGCSAASLGYLLGAREHLIATAYNIEDLCHRAEQSMDELTEMIDDARDLMHMRVEPESDDEPCCSEPEVEAMGKDKAREWVETIDENYEAGHGFTPSFPAFRG